MLAYVFWHWRQPQIDAQSYQADLISFHRTLAEHRPSGFHWSRVLQLASAPWLGRAEESYEDWYVIENSAALDTLDAGAVSGARKPPHDEVARRAEGGTGGLYRLRLGAPHLPTVHTAYWFAKPAGMSYETLYRLIEPVVEQTRGTLWVRQMTMGPAAEFCLHCPDAVAAFPEPLQMLSCPVWQLWISEA